MTEIDPPKEIFDALYTSAGVVVIHWAILEQALEHWVALIYRSPNGKQGERRIPYLYGAKITFLKKSFANLPLLRPSEKEALSLIGEIEEMAPIRATLVHGSISSYDPETQLLKFVRLPIDKQDDIHVISEEYLSIPQILDAGTKMLKLMTRALKFGQHLVNIFM
jgi:hypothetical protein